MSSILEIRGGEPNISSIAAVSTTGAYYKPLAKDPATGRYTFVTKYIQVYNTGGEILELYFSAADFAADANFLPIPITTGMWEGPAEARGVWLKSASATTAATVIFYQRRG